MKLHLFVLPVSILIGAILAVAWPSSGQAGTGIWYAAGMAPPTGHPYGENVYLTCGWHAGACGSTSGIALDWDDTASDPRNVYFRGGFQRSNTPNPDGTRLKAHTFNIIISPSRCDEMATDVIENYINQIRYGMHYLHANKFGVADYVPIGVSTAGVGQQIRVGQMVADDGGCPGQWYHVHEFLVVWGAKVDTLFLNSFPCCDYGPPYNQYPNLTHLVRWADWEEGTFY